MTIRLVEKKSGNIAIVNSETPIITNAQTALDFVLTVFYNHGCKNIAINKAAIIEDFFRLSSGIAGEITQKLVNY